MINKVIDNREFFCRNEKDIAMLEEQLSYMHKAYFTETIGVKDGDIVLDGGANYGAFTHMALKAGAKRVIAFEANPFICECYRQTFLHDSVYIHNKALADRKGMVEFREGKHGDDGKIYKEPSAKNPKDLRKGLKKVLTRKSCLVPSTDLDDFYISKIDFVKLDIEGAETMVVKNGELFFKKCKPKIAICLYHNKTDFNKIPIMFLQKGYRIFINPNEGYPILMGEYFNG